MITRHSLKIFRTCLWALLLTVFLCSAAPAFQYKDMDININAKIAEKYDDNIFFAKENKKRDFITTLGIGVNAKYQGRRRSLDFRGNINQRFNSEYSDIKNSSEDVGIDFRSEISRYDKVELNYSFNHFYAPESFEQELERTTARSETYDNRFNAEYSRDISEYFRVDMSYAYRQKNFSEEEKEDREDTSYNEIGLELRYKPGIATTLLVAYGYEMNNFNDEKINRYTGGLKYYITKRFYFDGRAGWDESFSGTANRTRLHVNASLTNEIDENSVAKISYKQGERFDSEEGSISYNWQVRGELKRHLLKQLSGSVSAFYGETEFEETKRTETPSGDPDSIEIKKTNTLLGVNAELTYEIQEDMRVKLLYTYADRDITIDGDSTTDIGYIRNTVTLSLTRSF